MSVSLADRIWALVCPVDTDHPIGVSLAKYCLHMDTLTAFTAGVQAGKFD